MSRATRPCPAVPDPSIRTAECRTPLTCDALHPEPSELDPEPYAAHEASCPNCGTRTQWFTEEPYPHNYCTP